jgi:oligoribonuclease
MGRFNMLLAALDLEATGLDCTKGSILELGIAVFNKNLELEGSFNRVITPLPGYEDDFSKLDPVVVEMHTKNGLFDDIRAGIGVTCNQAELDAMSFLDRWPGQKFMLVGNSVYLDRWWLKEHMPKLEARFMRHIIDVSSLNRVCELFNKKLFNGRPRYSNVHRAYDDAEYSMSVLRYYRDNGAFSTMIDSL